MNNTVSFFSGENIPLEMHKVRMVQKLNLISVDERLEAIQEAGNNTFLLKNKDVFLDMLTDSGVNAMSDKQYAAMMVADDSYAGSETFYRLEEALKEVFGTKFFLPAHQGRACENILAQAFVKEDSTAIMNFHFTTTKAHITRLGGSVEEILKDEGLNIDSDCPFKGNIDMDKLKKLHCELGNEKISFVRVEAGTNLIGGQPVSLSNMKEVTDFCREKGLLSILDASLLADNLYFIKTKDESCKDKTLKEITSEIGQMFDIIYFSARKLGCARGGGIVTNNQNHFDSLKTLVPLFEGFLTYGGMSIREMEALAVGLIETLDIDVISQTPLFVNALCEELMKKNVPVVTPAGGLGCHIDASRFVDHIPQEEYPAGALAAAIYIASGVRGMERGTMSEQRNPDGSEQLASMELVRLALPKRVFTLSQVKFVADRVSWLFENRHLIGGLEFTEEPETLRFFLGKLKAKTDWQEKLCEKFKKDMPSGL
ncbi:tryptophanase [Anaeropeptidivorans aminofermentans]|uniref:tryptophanase n=1 Tax=Anaeropeptidivorans aminofermentans TaxID=2934315 RepID=UPI002025B159|nr:tryptophanase [Anaeropeptidivorans aminofermentans]